MNTPIAPVQAPAPVAQGFSITSLVLGCCSIVFFWLWGIVPVLAIVFGGIALSKQKAAGVKPSGMAVAGLVLGIVFTAITALFFLAALS